MEAGQYLVSCQDEVLDDQTWSSALESGMPLEMHIVFYSYRYSPSSFDRRDTQHCFRCKAPLPAQSIEKEGQFSWWLVSNRSTSCSDWQISICFIVGIATLTFKRDASLVSSYVLMFPSAIFTYRLFQTRVVKNDQATEDLNYFNKFRTLIIRTYACNWCRSVKLVRPSVPSLDIEKKWLNAFCTLV